MGTPADCWCETIKPWCLRCPGCGQERWAPITARLRVIRGTPRVVAAWTEFPCCDRELRLGAGWHAELEEELLGGSAGA